MKRKYTHKDLIEKYSEALLKQTVNIVPENKSGIY